MRVRRAASIFGTPCAKLCQTQCLPQLWLRDVHDKCCMEMTHPTNKGMSSKRAIWYIYIYIHGWRSPFDQRFALGSSTCPTRPDYTTHAHGACPASPAVPRPIAQAWWSIGSPAPVGDLKTQHTFAYRSTGGRAKTAQPPQDMHIYTYIIHMINLCSSYAYPTPLYTCIYIHIRIYIYMYVYTYIHIDH